jgi:hypothetical protein
LLIADESGLSIVVCRAGPLAPPNQQSEISIQHFKAPPNQQSEISIQQFQGPAKSAIINPQSAIS